MEFSSKSEEKKYYERIATEEEFLKWYHDQEHPTYEAPSLTVDMVLLCYNRQEEQLKLLLIQRKSHPFRHSWALPGGFVSKGESTDDSVIRETLEETGVHINQNQIEQLYTFSTPNRDPRGWVVTVSYLAFIGEEPVDAGDDASQVRWFNLNRKQNTIVLENQETQIILDLETGESLGKDTLAFDHSQIILKAFHHVLETMMHDPRVLLVLGPGFTITDARKVFAKFLGIDFKNIDHSNLKKALNDHLEAIGERASGVGRPSKIYQLKTYKKISPK